MRRQRAWTLEVPPDAEARAIFGEAICIDNDGGITLRVPAGAVLGVSVGDAELFHVGFGVGEGTVIRFQARPIKR